MIGGAAAKGEPSPIPLDGRGIVGDGPVKGGVSGTDSSTLEASLPSPFPDILRFTEEAAVIIGRGFARDVGECWVASPGSGTGAGLGVGAKDGVGGMMAVGSEEGASPT